MSALPPKADMAQHTLGFFVPGVVVTLVGALSNPAAMAACIRAQNAASIGVTGFSAVCAFDFREALDFVVRFCLIHSSAPSITVDPNGDAGRHASCGLLSQPDR